MKDSTFLPIGTLLARQYKILQHIGAGGFGKTYLVEDQLGEKKVVKEFFISSMCTRDVTTQSVTVSVAENKQSFQEQLAKFKEEARRIYSLSHPNIVKVSALFDENDTAYYVMNYVEGESLAQKSRKGKLSELQIMRYLDQLLSALEYIHSRGITHLDIKPGNIMIDRNDNVVLIDFGASKLFNAQSVNKTMMTSMRPPFTPGYAPIEQENGNVNDMGPHCDIYALGATLYYLYTGEKAPSPFDIFQKGLPPIPQASPSMQKVIKGAMEFDKNKRIKSVAEFRSEIGQLDDSPITIIDNGEKTVVAEDQSKKFSNLKTFTEIVNGVSFKMIAVEGGTFKMGAQSKDPNQANFDPDAFDDESPVHDVTLDSFYLAEFVVTEDLWDAVMNGDNPKQSKGWLQKILGNTDVPRVGYPKTNISWNDCQEFIKGLNRLTGKNFSLPTEAQWEYAARGGNMSRDYKYSGSNSLIEVAWYFVNAWTLKEVGLKKPNELGLYDMSGNVCEWCADLYDRKYYIRPECKTLNPENQTIGINRVFRGGGWYSNEQNCRITIRNNDRPNGRLEVGFRLALCP